MPNIIKILRNATSGVMPTGKTEAEPFWNEADKQFGVVDAAGASQSLIAIRFFSDLAAYDVGDFVVEAGKLYRCIIAVTVPAAFDSTEWEVVGAVDPSTYATITYVDGEIAAIEAQLGNYLPLAGGTVTGEIILPGVPTDPLAATDKTYVDTVDADLQAQINILEANLLFSGSIAVVTDAGDYTPESGMTDGPLPVADATNTNKYVIVIDGGTPLAGNIPALTYAAADWLVSDGTTWNHLPLGIAAAAAVIAPNVALSPDVNTYGDVQAAITDLFTVKLDSNSIIDAGTY
jgi:hypothetical protein